MDIKQNIAKTIAANVGADAAELCEWLETPPNPDMGDVAFPCFKLAKTMRKAPNMIAASLAPALGEIDGISRIEPMGGYINFFADKTSFARTTLERVLDEGARYGGSDVGSGKTVCLDYSSINIAKPFHIGHLSTTAIGNALRRIYDHLGYKTVSINHLGDWGTQFGKMILAYKLWGDKETVEKGGVRAMMQLYVRFHDEAEKDDSLNDSARAWFKRIEQHDPEAVEIFEWFKAITLKEVGKTYDLLGIKFDSYAGESFYEDKMQPVIDELREKHLLKVDNGASIVDLSEYSMPPCLILRSDGATLYATRDLAAAIYRKNTYDFDKLLYVVAYQQSLHFKQIFKVLELMGKDWVKDCVHVSFGMVSLTDGTLSTRHGRVVFLEDVLNAAIEKTLDVIKEKSPDLEDKETVARQIGVGAVVWGVVYNGRIKDIVFSWDKALNFDGETGPYAQYTHARCCSVLRKSGGYDRAKIDYSALSDEASSALVKAIAEFPAAVSEAAEKYEPYIISRSVINVCSCFNKFYYDNRIMDENEGVRNARLALTDAARNVIKTGLYLVGLEAPEKM
ncbi:MAG: arginine--tRNA ligase [Christensenellales bacterium]|nr:arginine--tRNA ligase [Clostridiales bacterium]MDD7414841.1 arginine--tRNA ligase [Clostridiales bacterium]MDY5732603.1 arginine--tRNA ligase [Eubacteriales bacterium]